MSKSKLNATQWEIVRDAPYWVLAAMAVADGRQALIVNRKESKALDKALESYKSSSPMVRDVVANDTDADKAIKKADMPAIEFAFSRISQIVESQCGSDELDAFGDFLLDIGKQVSAAGGEGVMGIGENTSKAETAALEKIAKLLRVTDADKRARRQAKAQAERRERAAEAAAAKKAREEAAAKAKQEREAAAKARAEKARIEREKREAVARAKKERAEKAAAAKKATEERIAQAKARAERMEAKRKEMEAAKAAAQAAAETSKFIAEHTVVSGDNLSFISKKYYGSTAHWKLIYEANKEVIGDNPNLIRVGQVFQIPRLPEK